MPEYVKPRKRPEITPGVTYEAQTGCGTIYVTINEDEKGQPIEVFARLGKAGGCACAQTEAVGRLASLCLRCNVDPEEIIKQLIGIRCDRSYGVGKNAVYSCADAVAKILREYLEEKRGEKRLEEQL